MGYISIASCKTTVSPLLTHWRYYSLALSQQFVHEPNLVFFRVACVWSSEPHIIDDPGPLSISSPAMPTSVSPQPGPSGDPRPAPVLQKGVCAFNPYFNNVRVFTVCVSSLLFLHGMLYEYTDGVLYHMGHRYPFSPTEQDFIAGVEKAGFIAFLLIVAFFGNRLHRPIMVGVGGVFTAVGCIFVTTPYWILGPLKYPETISQFLQNADCTQNSTLTVDSEGTLHCSTLESQHAQLGMPMSLVCFGQFLIGTGGAFYTGLGIVHIEENTEQKYAVLLLGKMLRQS